MPIIATDTARVGNWLKWEVGETVGYTRNEVDYTAADDGILLTGTVISYDEGDDEWTTAGAVLGDRIAIVISDTSGVDPIPVTDAGPTRIVVLEKGPAIIRKEGLVLGAGAVPADVYAALEELGINAYDSVQ